MVSGAHGTTTPRQCVSVRQHVDRQRRASLSRDAVWPMAAGTAQDAAV